MSFVLPYGLIRIKTKLDVNKAVGNSNSSSSSSNGNGNGGDGASGSGRDSPGIEVVSL